MSAEQSAKTALIRMYTRLQLSVSFCDIALRLLTGHCDQFLHVKRLFTTRYVHGRDRLHILKEIQSGDEEGIRKYMDKSQNAAFLAM